MATCATCGATSEEGARFYPRSPSECSDCYNKRCRSYRKARNKAGLGEARKDIIAASKLFFFLEYFLPHFDGADKFVESYRGRVHVRSAAWLNRFVLMSESTNGPFIISRIRRLLKTLKLMCVIKDYRVSYDRRRTFRWVDTIGNTREHHYVVGDAVVDIIFKQPVSTVGWSGQTQPFQSRYATYLEEPELEVPDDGKAEQ